MDWLYETIKMIVKNEQIEAERPYRLTIKSEEDIPDNMEDIKSVIISLQYEGDPVIGLVQKILDAAPKLNKLSVFQELNWQEVCSLDLLRMKELTLKISGDINNELLEVRDLESLSIYAGEDCSAREMRFPQLDRVEHLTLNGIKGVKPSSFDHFSNLKTLEVKKIGVTDLDWLKSSDYQLKKLVIDDIISDCSGLLHQKSIEQLYISNSVFLDVTPIAEMNNLSLLYMYNSHIDDELLRRSGIERVVVTQHDYEEKSLDDEVHDLCRDAAQLIIARKKTLKELDTLKQWQRKWILRDFSESLEQQIQKSLVMAYMNKVERMKETKSPAYRDWPADEYLGEFQKRAKKMYPFMDECGRKLYGERWKEINR